MTTEVVTSYVKTPAHTPSIVWSMGLANLVSGLLGGMGGDAMIGLSTINCLNGGRGRLAPTVTALGVMLCTIVAYPVLDFIPISALAGVMIVVVLHTFKWAKIPIVLSACLPCSWRKPINESMACTPLPKWLRLPLEVDRWEALIIVVVSVLTGATSHATLPRTTRHVPSHPLSHTITPVRPLSRLQLGVRRRRGHRSLHPAFCLRGLAGHKRRGGAARGRERHQAICPRGQALLRIGDALPYIL